MGLLNSMVIVVVPPSILGDTSLPLWKSSLSAAEGYFYLTNNYVSISLTSIWNLKMIYPFTPSSLAVLFHSSTIQTPTRDRKRPLLPTENLWLPTTVAWQCNTRPPPTSYSSSQPSSPPQPV
ncbi:uncharacterized protein LY89DRAFT_98739 [Mollisia scopiformis]|uniref:Uncharacterized protein n=1 Tax=Mollisia scopiformis TaxID=149040 RepID=A0A194X6V5_MOLSC|nr:uncharacterized protein LY89DRAFT_98739 [Mollisia scopiformis]KUJ15908.1 hypothetical protein LY89DRAFT_98739 [Mollisia scopiformis]